jgi:hypothetical protein
MDIRLRFSPSLFADLEKRYVKSNRDQDRENRISGGIASQVKRSGLYTKADLLEISIWKSARNTHHVEKNDPIYVEEITHFALSAKCERSRIEALTLLRGVSWPTASVLLHFGHVERYPILDFRALWSLSVDVPGQYSFDFWWGYVEACRRLADENGLEMRALDRALWQYSAENQEVAS